MRSIVKLILVCQIKDVRIPQLIPLIWIFSNLILLVLLILISLIYRIGYYPVFMNSSNLYYKNSVSWWW